jgi:hypothetical protein
LLRHSGFASADGGFGTRADGAFDGDVQQCRFSAIQGALQSGREIFRSLDEFPITA